MNRITETVSTFLTFNLKAKIMRCPKCSYISFDKMEICGGCKKNIAKFSQELSGVTFKADVPNFLFFVKEEKDEEESAAIDAGIDDDGGEIDIGMGEAEIDQASESEIEENAVEFSDEIDTGVEIDTGSVEEKNEIEFDMTEKTDDLQEDKEEIAFDLSSGEEESVQLDVDIKNEKKAAKSESDLSHADTAQELNLSMEGLDDLDFNLEEAPLPAPKATPKPEKGTGSKPKKEAVSAKEPSLDLSGIDLSGLMPSPAVEEQKKQVFALDDIGELSLETAKVGKEKTGKAVKKGKAASNPAADSLPDLAIEGLDLGAASKKPKLAAAAKTGTALDSFDIDLGDLLAKPAPPATSGKKKK